MEALASLFAVLSGLVAGVVEAVIKRLSQEPHPESIPGIRGRIARWAQDHRAPRPR